MSNNIQDEAWQAKVRASLDNDTQNIDAATLSALKQARVRALAQLETPAPGVRESSNWLWASGAVASVAAIAVVVLLLPTKPDVVTDTEVDVVENELLLDEHDLEFYSNLDFYIWLDEKGLLESEA